MNLKTFIILSLFLLLSLQSTIYAGEYHSIHTNSLRCVDCHTMHNMEGGAPRAPGGPYPKLLIRATQLELCMSCHDGSDPNAPDEVSTGTASSPNDILSTAYSSPYKGAAGWFQADYATAPSGRAHDLFSSGSVTAPGGTWTSAPGGMVCSDCHNVHGNQYYRNLLPNPGGSPGRTVVLNTDVFEQVPVSLPPTANPAIAYDSANIGYVSGLSNWCAGCHTDFYGDANTGYSPTFPHHTRHPSDSRLDGTSPTYNFPNPNNHIDAAHWVGGTGAGFDTGTLENGIAGIPRIRFEGAAGSFTNATTVASSNRVFCLSCHKAHGSKYDSLLLWPWKATTVAQKLEMTSGCQQCHNQ